MIVAAGSGERLGSPCPKALVLLAGRTLVEHAVAGTTAAGLPAPVVVYPRGWATAFEEAVVSPVAAMVPGAEHRRASVRAGVAAVSGRPDVVVVHDAARPLTPVGVIGAAVGAVTDAARVLAAAPALPIVDTLKRVSGRDVVATVDRADLVAVQTPQVFRAAALTAALAGGDEDTDELTAVERLVDGGRLEGRVTTVTGSPWSRKVTYPEDLVVLEALAGADVTGLSAP